MKGEGGEQDGGRGVSTKRKWSKRMQPKRGNKHKGQRIIAMRPKGRK